MAAFKRKYEEKIDMLEQGKKQQMQMTQWYQH
jgi:hypothetical protein